MKRPVNCTFEEHVSAIRRPELKAILSKWICVLKEYRKETTCVESPTGDVPWYYHERAQIGFLAAAVWKSGGIALEEWRTEKSRRDGSNSQGRCDLWIQRAGEEFFVEAKQLWLRSLSDSIVKVRHQCEVAAKDAGRLDKKLGHKRLGMLAITPIVQGGNGVEELLYKLTTEIQTKIEHLAGLAWLLPRMDRTAAPCSRIRLGIILVIIEAQP